jgi:hypothetical protein
MALKISGSVSETCALKKRDVCEFPAAGAVDIGFPLKRG